MTRIVARVLLMMGIAAVSGCTAWHTEAPGPLARAAFDSTKTYRLTLRSGAQIVAPHPTVTADSLTWIRSDTTGPHRAPVRRGIPLSDVNTIEVEEFDIGGSLLLTILAIALAAAAASASASPNNFPPLGF